jgi:hypothetical protein
VIEFQLPWVALLLPLPWLLRRILPQGCKVQLWFEP